MCVFLNLQQQQQQKIVFYSNIKKNQINSNQYKFNFISKEKFSESNKKKESFYILNT